MPAPFLNRERLRLLHARGLSDAEIAAKLGVTGQTVLRHRRVMGLPRTSIAKLWTPERLDELRRRAAAEETAGQIAASWACGRRRCAAPPRTTGSRWARLALPRNGRCARGSPGWCARAARRRGSHANWT